MSNLFQPLLNFLVNDGAKIKTPRHISKCFGEFILFGGGAFSPVVVVCKIAHQFKHTIDWHEYGNIH